MRKVLLVIIFCIPFLGKAQVKWGIRAGLNFSSIKFNSFNPEKKLLTRLNAGTTIEIPIDENWLVLTGPYYAGKGIIHTRSLMSNRIDSVTIRLNYIELPINIGYKFAEENNNQFTIAGGPYISYGFNGIISIRNSQAPPTTRLHKKETDQYKRLEAGINFSGLYEIKERYGIRVDFSKSLLNIARVEKQKNIVVGFSLYWYMKKKATIEE